MSSKKNESRVFYTRFQTENIKRTNLEKEERSPKKKKKRRSEKKRRTHRRSEERTKRHWVGDLAGEEHWVERWRRTPTTLGDLDGEERWVERRRRTPVTKKNIEHEQMHGRRREIKWWNSSLKNLSSTWIFFPTSPLTTYKSRLINSSFILELEF